MGQRRELVQSWEAEGGWFSPGRKTLVWKVDSLHWAYSMAHVVGCPHSGQLYGTRNKGQANNSVPFSETEPGNMLWTLTNSNLPSDSTPEEELV